MVTAQFESDPTSSWNEGIQSDYDPELTTSKGFALSTSEVPSHSEISMSNSEYDGLNTSDIFFNYQYTTGNIDKTTITSNFGIEYHIHRSSDYYYGSHNPDRELKDAIIWANTLTIDKTEIVGYDFDYSITQEEADLRGYAYGGYFLRNLTQTGAWIIWVR